MAKIILTPQLVGGWLQEMYDPVKLALQSGIEAVVEGRIQGALSVDKKGKVMLLSRLKATMEPEALAALMGGLPAEVGGDLEIGWNRDKTVGRLVEGWCYARFATPGMAAVPFKDVLEPEDLPKLATEEVPIAFEN